MAMHHFFQFHLISFFINKKIIIILKKTIKKFGGFIFYLYLCSVKQKHMKTKINVRNFKHVERIEKFGKTFESFYCHNYYYDEINDILILSENDDDMAHSYYIIDENGLTHIGCGFGIYSIFDDEEDYDGEPPMENGIVELDDTWC